MTEEYTIRSTPDTVNWGTFDPQAESVLEIESGDTVTIETVTVPMRNHSELLTGQGIPRSDILEDELTVLREVPRDGLGPHVVTGPVFVNDAEPGDILEVHVEEIELRAPYGINSFFSGAGTLSDRFSRTEHRVVPLDSESQVAVFSNDIEIPLHPFFGIMAVAPSMETGPASTGPPSYFGGNMDNRELGEGSRIFFPVNTDGARFYAGDGHAAQGDGEVNATAIETSLTGTFKFTLHKDLPQLSLPVGETDDAYIVMGFKKQLGDALSHAVQSGVSFLVAQKRLSPESAYQLCSIAVDFRVTQGVNGNKGIHGRIPKSIFADEDDIEPSRFADE